MNAKRFFIPALLAACGTAIIGLITGQWILAGLFCFAVALVGSVFSNSRKRSG